MKNKIVKKLCSLNVHLWDKSSSYMQIEDVRTCCFCKTQQQVVDVEAGTMGGHDLTFQTIGYARYPN